ncbi:MAG: nucleotidyl transferase AbiEii/AbiGii toxin family protein [Candidatus Methanosuratus sp.]|nr:nucleotidyl transferase AbiEii/AbiGii toxin family protein [Candidatus Methanosuratincola sp.]
MSEFISFVAVKSGIKRVKLVEQEVIIQRILKEVYSSPHFRENYLFKGGSCLVKCYFGFYRFSVDLDFTWRKQKVWKVGEKELRRKLLKEIKAFGQLLEMISKRAGLDFMNEPRNRRYFEFGGGGRMVTFKLWRGPELLKIQVNFLEALLFPSKSLKVKTLLDGVTLSRDEEAYFEEFLDFYRPFEVDAYDEREILCEKVRAILTRRAQKLRDFYDIFMLDAHGFKAERVTDEIAKKVRASLYYKKYRDNLDANKRAMKFSTEVLEDPFERELFVQGPPRNFEKFLTNLLDLLKDIVNLI